eukprot:gene12197-13453_t
MASSGSHDEAASNHNSLNKVEEIEPQISKESVKVAADSIGVDRLNDDAAKFLADDLTFRLKELIQNALKFSQNSKRNVLKTQDIDHALRLQNVEPLYGFTSKEFAPFRFASGGGREVYFLEEPEIDLEDLLSQNLPKIPIAVNLRSHWLAVDGKQPSIPENPPPINKEQQLKSAVEAANMSDNVVNELDIDKIKSAEHEVDHIAISKMKSDGKGSETKNSNTAKKINVKLSETKLKPVVTHELSVEQQLYYKEITEACVGSYEQKRTEALHSLASDPGLYQLLPRFSTFISEGVKINVAQHNLALLIYLLRMIKALMENPTLYLEKYLHELVPSILTCIVSKQLCPKPDVDNHWALRDFAARLMAQLCRTFSCPTNNIQSRITKILCKSLYNDKAPLVMHYGAIAGLAELGIEVIKVLVMPRLKIENDAITKAFEASNSVERCSAEHLQNLLVKHCSLVAVRIRTVPDILEQYQFDYGKHLGGSIFKRVVQLRQGLLNHPKTPNTPTTPTSTLASSIH